MNHDQAVKIADHLTKDFRGYGPGRPTWLRVLDPLDFDRAFLAYMALLGSVSEKPAVVEFLREYELTAPPKPRAPKVPCTVCEGEGWKTTRFTALGMRYEGVVPCDCNAGRPHDDVHRETVKFNARQPWHHDAQADELATHALEAEVF